VPLRSASVAERKKSESSLLRDSKRFSMAAVVRATASLEASPSSLRP
jgi:hypothetical protein